MRGSSLMILWSVAAVLLICSGSGMISLEEAKQIAMKWLSGCSRSPSSSSSSTIPTTQSVRRSTRSTTTKPWGRSSLLIEAVADTNNTIPPQPCHRGSANVWGLFWLLEGMSKAAHARDHSMVDACAHGAPTEDSHCNSFNTLPMNQVAMYDLKWMGIWRLCFVHSSLPQPLHSPLPKPPIRVPHCH